MKILILNQAFYPDVVSTAQHATDLALALAGSGHKVTVVCGRRGYDDASLVFPAREVWKNIRIFRIRSSAMGKSAKWRRAADFASFMMSCTLRILQLAPVDVIVSLTSPPLLPFLAALAVPAKARALVLWSMDLNPDEAIAAGWLSADSLSTLCLSRMLLYSLHRADRIVALDRFMEERILAKNVAETKITVIPPWSHDDHVCFDSSGRNEFRALHGLTDKFVVMYSGNHSPCHPLDTLVAAAEFLTQMRDIVFCFVGGGSEFRKVKDRAQLNHLDNIRCFPYQPLEKLSGSLSAADLHVVVLGTPFVGIVHPCKVYNVLAVGKRFLYIGPETSHITDLMASERNHKLGYWHEHGDVEGVIASIMAARADANESGGEKIVDRFSKKTLLPRMVTLIQEVAEKTLESRDPVNSRLAAERHD
jgi:colanic acid biosynthesis glycosyl transferase WcaI